MRKVISIIAIALMILLVVAGTAMAKPAKTRRQQASQQKQTATQTTRKKQTKKTRVEVTVCNAKDAQAAARSGSYHFVGEWNGQTINAHKFVVAAGKVVIVLPEVGTMFDTASGQKITRAAEKTAVKVYFFADKKTKTETSSQQQPRKFVAPRPLPKSVDVPSGQSSVTIATTLPDRQETVSADALVLVDKAEVHGRNVKTVKKGVLVIMNITSKDGNVIVGVLRKNVQIDNNQNWMIKGAHVGDILAAGQQVTLVWGKKPAKRSAPAQKAATPVCQEPAVVNGVVSGTQLNPHNLYYIGGYIINKWDHQHADSAVAQMTVCFSRAFLLTKNIKATGKLRSSGKTVAIRTGTIVRPEKFSELTLQIKGDDGKWLTWNDIYRGALEYVCRRVDEEVGTDGDFGSITTVKNPDGSILFANETTATELVAEASLLPDQPEEEDNTTVAQVPEQDYTYYQLEYCYDTRQLVENTGLVPQLGGALRGTLNKQIQLNGAYVFEADGRTYLPWEKVPAGTTGTLKKLTRSPVVKAY